MDAIDSSLIALIAANALVDGFLWICEGKSEWKGLYSQSLLEQP